jgi:branched-chain amino acid transport system permease protein
MVGDQGIGGKVFFQQLTNGLIIGSAYALISTGLTMSFGIMHFSNFAHGTIFMVGAYFMYFFCMFLGIPFFLSVALSMLVVGLLGVVLDRFVFRPTYGKHLLDVLMSLGLFIFLENAVLRLVGAETLNVKTPYTDVILSLLSASVTLQRIIIFVASLVLIAALYAFLNFTRIGKGIVATAQSPRGALLVGIDSSRVYMITFALSTALAAAGGALLAPIFYVYPTMGNMPVITAFVVVVLGGMGNVHGAVVGGFIVGLVETFGGAYISSDYKNVFGFVILVAVLLMRPQGIFGRRP